MGRKQRAAYLTIEETPAALRVSERTVRRWIARGVLPSRTIDRTVRIPAATVRPAPIEKRRPPHGRPPRGKPAGEPDLARWAARGGPFDWLYDPREDVHTLDDGEPV